MSRHHPAAARPVGTAPIAGEETSSVRRGGGPRSETARPPSGVIAVERSVRIAAKVARAQELLQGLALDDPRARLLRVAALRRDEVLLDGLLAEVDSGGASARRSWRPPSR